MYSGLSAKELDNTAKFKTEDLSYQILYLNTCDCTSIHDEFSDRQHPQYISQQKSTSVGN